MRIVIVPGLPFSNFIQFILATPVQVKKKKKKNKLK